MLRNVLVIDTEATTYATGHPFSEPNRLMCVGTLFNGVSEYHDIEHSNHPYRASLERIAQLFSEAELVVGFNIKYDLHWIRKYLPHVVFPNVHDCQLAEFLISHQTAVYPSLESCSDFYGLPPKLHDIEDYWSRGIDTDQVPLEILKARVLSDVNITWELYQKQLGRLEGQEALFKLQCADILPLQEMEFNGLLFDEQEAARKGVETTDEIKHIKEGLDQLYPDVNINWNSGDHLSAVLYGGLINQEALETVHKPRKDGTVRIYERKCLKQITFPRLVEPLPNTEVKDTKDLTDADIKQLNERKAQERKPWIYRTYYTNEQVLKSLPVRGKAKEILQANQRLAELEKLSSTYYLGIPKLIAELKWVGGIIHGQFNQVVARTGRLSSSKPNLQNFAGVIKPLFKSRYAD